MFRKPTRAELGVSPSEFKTLLKGLGFKVPRDFFGFSSSVAKRQGRLYRFRWWAETFEVDISCPVEEFDRWANSTDRTISLSEFFGE